MKPSSPFIIAACLCFLAITGCSKSLASLAGTYCVQDQGRLDEFVRVVEQGGRYFLYERQNNKWMAPGEVKPVGKAQFEKLTHEPVNDAVVGLVSNNVAIFQVPKGWRSGQFVCNTGYWLACFLGPIELHKE